MSANSWFAFSSRFPIGDAKLEGKESADRSRVWSWVCTIGLLGSLGTRAPEVVGTTGKTIPLNVVAPPTSWEVGNELGEDGRACLGVSEAPSHCERAGAPGAKWLRSNTGSKHETVAGVT